LQTKVIIVHFLLWAAKYISQMAKC
jgi:hypothetical protein